MSSANVSVPEVIAEEISISSIYRNFNARGAPTSYGIDLQLPPMNLFQSLKSTDQYMLLCKVESTLAAWAKKYERFLDGQHRERRASDVEEMNAEAQEALAEMQGLLAHTLDVNDAVDWEAVKRKDTFRIDPAKFGVGADREHLQFDKRGKPTGFAPETPPREPTLEQVKAGYGLFSKLFRGQAIQKDFDQKHAEWRARTRRAEEENARRAAVLKTVAATFQKLEAAFEEEKRRDNEALADIRRRYQQGEARAVEEYCDLVLSASRYPDCLPRNWTLEYRQENRMAVVEMDLPEPVALPAVESYRYVKARDEVVEKLLPEAARRKLYDSVIYQVCIRTLHELFEADTVGAIDAVAFNGVVTARNKATGALESKVILSVCADKAKFLAYDLANVDPKATFKHLKGVAAAALFELTPIPPVIRLDKSDRRFIEGRSVDVDSSVNLAAMHWGDFEHLIRELFEQEFAAGGGEVKVTQASADGGVDAIAFDPDPIRGGKIVIQAKRYTNTVGVAAVRDLFGTVMNEGATKGILVTTSDYGRDSYEFAKDKPLTLLNGSNLLSLLEKHGRKARIDTAEARKMLSA